MANNVPLSNMSLQQLCEMNAKAKHLVALMKKGIVSFVFKKKSTGKIRKSNGTLKKELIPLESRRKAGRPKKHPDDLVIYYDTDKKAIRSFKDYLLQKIHKPKPLKKIDTNDKQSEANKDNLPSKSPKSPNKKEDQK